MSTNTLNSVQSNFHFARLLPLKIIVALLVISYGIFNFSAHYWVIVGLVVAITLAFSDRVSRINAAYENEAPSELRASSRDGGSFQVAEKSRTVRSGRSVVNDGGTKKS